MEHISIDFKWPLPMSTYNMYLLAIVDEYSWYPFAFPARICTLQQLLAAEKFCLVFVEC